MRLVPHNFVVVKGAGEKGCEYVEFNTDEHGMIKQNVRINQSNLIEWYCSEEHDSPPCLGGSTSHEAPIFACKESTSAARIEENSLENTTISDVLNVKGKGAHGFCLWCATDDSVYEAVKSMTLHNVGALVVVKLWEKKSIAGIITERDYLRKIIVQGRSSK
ncbi:CBS domain-containing protein CBSX3-mitochondrial [Striga hermonthica]|uniref:CBS domain-containing protein CBSX3-mitochondrial n=1 Tax=Striga hermonthica TaxID=68872 RepID=A0A9N7RK97_STRHE|nr:CBS domain-containing protein CBSX3-mitochondrial [Striga hermonthica]